MMSEEAPKDFLAGFSDQYEARNCLWQAYKSGRIASSYLFSGPSGVGKFVAALEFAKFLKCPNKRDGSPCLSCRSCRSIAAWDNPDILILFPMPLSVWESDEQSKYFEEFHKTPHIRPSFTRQPFILKEMIIEIISFLSIAATSEGGKFVLLPDAHRMNREAANAFLKSLEEPPIGTHIILSTDRPDTLMATIRSRTQIVRFRRLSTREIIRHLVDGYLFPPERASAVAHLAEGSVATALKMASEEYQEIRRQSINLLIDASENKIYQVWDWAANAQGEIDYARDFMKSLVSLARDVVVFKTQSGSILNNDVVDVIERCAEKVKTYLKASQLVKDLCALQEDIEHNMQYSLFYGAVAATILQAFQEQ